MKTTTVLGTRPSPSEDDRVDAPVGGEQNDHVDAAALERIETWGMVLTIVSIILLGFTLYNTFKDFTATCPAPSNPGSP